jgi:hypothetical protein
MTDSRFPDPREPDGAAASAWLAGDLDPEAAAAFERRVAEDPATGAELAAVHDAVVRLQGLDETTPPEGYGARLRDRLAHERAAMTRTAWPAQPPPPSPPQGERAGTRTPTGDAQVVSLDRRRRLSRTVLSVAAVLLLVVAGFSGIARFLGAGGAGGDSAEVAEAPAAGEDTAQEGAAEQDDGAGAGEPEAEAEDELQAREEAAQDAPLAAPPAAPETGIRRTASGPPVLAAEPLILGSDPQAALLERYALVPEAGALRGQPADAAFGLLAEAGDALATAPPVNGVAPGACLDAALKGEPGGTTPARVDVLEVDGVPATAYVLVSAPVGSATLSQVDVLVLAAATCDELARTRLP